MTHDELLAKLLEYDNSCNTAGSDKDVPKSYNWDCYELHSMASALRAAVELHKNYRLDGIYYECSSCGKSTTYCPTIQAIEKELK